MTFWEVLRDLLLDNTLKATRSSWSPPQIKERYIFVETAPSGDQVGVMFSDKTAVQYQASSDDLLANDWSTI
mgnify:CR=1 FL=1